MALNNLITPTRSNIWDFIDIAQNPESPVWVRACDPFTSLNFEDSATVATKQYICSKTKSSKTTAHEGKFSVEADGLVQEWGGTIPTTLTPFELLRSIVLDQKVGSEAEIDILRVYEWESLGENMYNSRKYHLSVANGNEEGNEDGELVYSFELNQVGDMVKGTTTITAETITFTPNPIAAKLESMKTVQPIAANE